MEREVHIREQSIAPVSEVYAALHCTALHGAKRGKLGQHWNRCSAVGHRLEPACHGECSRGIAEGTSGALCIL